MQWFGWKGPLDRDICLKNVRVTQSLTESINLFQYKWINLDRITQEEQKNLTKRLKGSKERCKNISNMLIKFKEKCF